MSSAPTVTIAIPTLDEEDHLPELLRAVAAQTYPNIVEVLVVDGGSRDATVDIAAAQPGVRVLDNPARIQAAALNLAIDQAKGELLVRLDAHAQIEPDYVERCVTALAATGSAMVGGAQRPVATTWVQRGVAAAMRSRFGFGAAGYHREDRSGWVDTVWLGAYPTNLARHVGGYDESLPVNEDAEFARRMAGHGGIWLERSIVGHYVPRSTLGAVARQFARYGYWRARTVRRDPRSMSPRQLPAPLLVLGLLSPWRRHVAGAYALVVLAASGGAWRRDDPGATALLVVTPVLHLSWGIGMLVGLLDPRTRRP